MVGMKRSDGKMKVEDRVEQPSAFYVRVTNMNEGEFGDRHEGVYYVFEPGKPINIPAAAAEHIFGWNPSINAADWTHMSKRCGWNTKKELDTGEGRKTFENFLVEGVNVAIVEVPPNMTPEKAQEAVRLASNLPPEPPEA